MLGCERSVQLCAIHSSVGRPKHVRVMAGALEGDIFIGPKAEVRKLFLLVHLWFVIFSQSTLPEIGCFESNTGLSLSFLAIRQSSGQSQG